VTASAGRDKQIEDTLDKLQRGNIGRDTIALLTARLVELENPGKTAEFESDSSLKITNLDGSSFTLNLHNMWAECERTPEERPEIVARYVRILTSQVSQERDPVERENVIALVRNNVYREYIDEGDRELITRHFVGNLWIVYGVDRSESTDVLKKSTAVSLGLDTDSLLHVGVENIERLLGQMEWEPYRECLSLTSEDITYASSALLLDYVWEHARSFVKGDPVVAVPARDTVLLTGSEHKEGLIVLRDETEYISRNGHHIICESLLRWRNGTWELFS
jgi:uncharacterized protein YtpQ (UPF0354 family)